MCTLVFLRNFVLRVFLIVKCCFLLSLRDYTQCISVSCFAPLRFIQGVHRLVVTTRL